MPDEPVIPTATEAAPTAGQEPVAFITAQGKRETRPRDAIRSHDFRQSGFLAPSELRRLRLRHEQFVRAAAARLAMFLRVEVTVQLAKLQIVGYQKFTEALTSPTHITFFKAEPLKGASLLVISPRLGLALVDRLLGGAGQMPATARDLSEIEIALIDQVALLILSEWCNQWPEVRDLRPTLLGHENNSRFLQTSPPDTAMLVLSLTAGLADALETIHIAIPYTSVEPLVRLLGPAGLQEAESPAARPAKLVWNREFDDVTVPVVAEWRGLMLSAGEITRLRPGNILMLDPKCASQVQLRLGHVPKFLARPGVRAGHWAVELTSPAPS